MVVLKTLFGFFLCTLLLFAGSAPSHAASSAAIRAFDDVKPEAQDFSGQKLVQSEFGDANFAGANFDGADLRGAVFNGAKLTNANLHGVDFSDGIAYITDFANADLTDAILNSAMLLKSSFKGATVTGADFSDAAIDRAQVIALCKTASGTNPVTGVDTRDSLGCK
jgi:uncharacterized protein YjbI with pentapeptide repeats